MRQREAATDVVVVDVGLEHAGDDDAQLLGLLQIDERVSLRVDDHGDLAVADQVAAVAETGGVEADHVQGRDLPGRAGAAH